MSTQSPAARVVDAAQAVTDGAEDRIDYFKVPSHLMAALALALDDVASAQSPAAQASSLQEERVAFQRWLGDRTPHPEVEQWQWEAWQARAAQAAHSAPEPVAWRYRYHAGGSWRLADTPALGSINDDIVLGMHPGYEEQPLYTAPPASAHGITTKDKE